MDRDSEAALSTFWSEKQVAYGLSEIPSLLGAVQRSNAG